MDGKSVPEDRLLKVNLFNPLVCQNQHNQPKHIQTSESQSKVTGIENRKQFRGQKADGSNDEQDEWNDFHILPL